MKKLIVSLFAGFLFVTGTHAQEVTNSRSTSVKVESPRADAYAKPPPMLIIDGKKYDYGILDLIDAAKIASVSIYKGEEALKKYQAKEVIVITSKKAEKGNQNDTIVVTTPVKIDLQEEPLILIDGKKATKDELKKLGPDAIDEMSIYKDAESKKKYNAPGGVIKVTLKKKK